MKNLLEYTELIVKSIKLLSWPVGSIYTSTKSTDPHKLFGGTWEPIQDTFLWCAGPKHAAGTSGGEETHTLVINEFPQHTHKVAVFTGGNGDGGDYYASYFSPDGRSASTSTGNAKLWHVWKDGMNKTWGLTTASLVQVILPVTPYLPAEVSRTTTCHLIGRFMPGKE